MIYQQIFILLKVASAHSQIYDCCKSDNEFVISLKILVVPVDVRSSCIVQYLIKYDYKLNSLVRASELNALLS